MLDDNTVETCVAIASIALVATIGPKFGLPEGLAGTAIAAIAGLAGRGVIQFGRDLSPFKDRKPELQRVDPS